MATTETAQNVESTAPTLTEAALRIERADGIVRRNAIWALGAGIVPAVFDIFAVTAVQVKMLKELSDLYGVKFTEDIAKKSVGSLLAGLGGVNVGAMLGGSLAKLIPGFGTIFGLITVPVMAGAFTIATGKVFLMHFESGGTVLNFNPEAMRSYFKAEFEKAKETVAQMQKDGQAKSTIIKPS